MTGNMDLRITEDLEVSGGCWRKDGFWRGAADGPWGMFTSEWLGERRGTHTLQPGMFVHFYPTKTPILNPSADLCWLFLLGPSETFSVAVGCWFSPPLSEMVACPTGSYSSSHFLVTGDWDCLFGSPSPHSIADLLTHASPACSSTPPHRCCSVRLS